jgi:hypothetical protein
MGVKIPCSINAAPRQGTFPERERFASMAAALLDEQVAGPMAYVLYGQIGELGLPGHIGYALEQYFKAARQPHGEPPYPSRLVGENRTTEKKGPSFSLDVAYAGEDRDAILGAVYNAPLGTADVCVYFEGLLPQQGETTDFISLGSASVGLYATIKPMPLCATYSLYLLKDGSIVDDDDKYAGSADAEELPTMDTYSAHWCLIAENEEDGPYDFFPHARTTIARYFGDDFLSGQMIN